MQDSYADWMVVGRRGQLPRRSFLVEGQTVSFRVVVGPTFAKIARGGPTEPGIVPRAHSKEGSEAARQPDPTDHRQSRWHRPTIGFRTRVLFRWEERHAGWRATGRDRRSDWHSARCRAQARWRVGTPV
jgi:hypothetical protein